MIVKMKNGMVGSMTNDILGHRVSSRYVAMENIAIGTVVVRGDSDTNATTADKGAKQIGIAIIKRCGCENVTIDNCSYEAKRLDAPYGNNDKDWYQKNECVSILEEGSTIVRVFEDVMIGDPVFYSVAGDASIAVDGKTKVVGMCGASGTELVDAVYETSAKSFETAVIRINK